MSGVKTPVAARDDSLPNSPVGGGGDDATVIADGEVKCTWNGQEFADGEGICADGIPYECHYGSWMKFPGNC